MIKIKKLEQKYLNKACILLNEVFPDEEIAPKSFHASLNKNKFNEFIKISPLTRSLEFFIAVDSKDDVIGTAGLYSMKEDFKDSYWLGWYCVSKEKRGHGVGRLLLDYCINQAKKRKKLYLKLRTSTAPEEKKAQEIYELNEFQIFEDNSEYIQNQKKEKDGDYNKIFRRKKF